MWKISQKRHRRQLDQSPQNFSRNSLNADRSVISANSQRIIPNTSVGPHGDLRQALHSKDIEEHKRLTPLPPFPGVTHHETHHSHFLALPLITLNEPGRWIQRPGFVWKLSFEKRSEKLLHNFLG